MVIDYYFLYRFVNIDTCSLVPKKLKDVKLKMLYQIIGPSNTEETLFQTDYYFAVWLLLLYLYASVYPIMIFRYDG